MLAVADIWKPSVLHCQPAFGFLTLLLYGNLEKGMSDFLCVCFVHLFYLFWLRKAMVTDFIDYLNIFLKHKSLYATLFLKIKHNSQVNFRKHLSIFAVSLLTPSSPGAFWLMCHVSHISEPVLVLFLHPGKLPLSFFLSRSPPLSFKDQFKYHILPETFPDFSPFQFFFVLSLWESWLILLCFIVNCLSIHILYYIGQPLNI